MAVVLEKLDLSLVLSEEGVGVIGLVLCWKGLL